MLGGGARSFWLLLLASMACRNSLVGDCRVARSRGHEMIQEPSGLATCQSTGLFCLPFRLWKFAISPEKCPALSVKRKIPDGQSSSGPGTSKGVIWWRCTCLPAGREGLNFGGGEGAGFLVSDVTASTSHHLLARCRPEYPSRLQICRLRSPRLQGLIPARTHRKPDFCRS
jgi:hypothetical protein